MRETGIQAFTHRQSVASTVWNIEHNLGHHPTHDVFIGTGATTKIYPIRVQHIDVNNLQLEFTDPQTGSVRLV